jgi:hypothetical protein
VYNLEYGVEEPTARINYIRRKQTIRDQCSMQRINPAVLLDQSLSPSARKSHFPLCLSA